MITINVKLKLLLLKFLIKNAFFLIEISKLNAFDYKKNTLFAFKIILINIQLASKNFIVYRITFFICYIYRINGPQ